MTRLQELCNGIDKIIQDVAEGWGGGEEIAKLARAAKVMQDQLSLMADGEGDDATVYQRMSNWAISEVERILGEE